jgi:hypothetical protein
MGKFQKSDSAETCGGKFPLVSMGGRAEGLACADPGVRIPIGASGNLLVLEVGRTRVMFLMTTETLFLGGKHQQYIYKITNYETKKKIIYEG